jgi:DNA-binding CsgD family transcriptional regulator
VLVGRESECARIDELLARARRGRSGALVLRGEAGIGKTALLEYAVARAEDMKVVSALGVQSETELEFSALLEVCRPMLDHLDDVPAAQAEALRGALGLAAAGARDRFLIGAATLSLLAAAGEVGPVLVVIDDAHWLDRASADALRFAVRRLVADPVCVLFATREGEERTFDAPGIPALAVVGLDRASASTLLARDGASRIAPDVADRLWHGTHGNPLALLELPSVLSARQLAGREPLDDPLPAGASVERAFVRRAHGLPADAQRALLVAAVAMTDDVSIVSAAAAALGADASALEAAEDVGLVHVRGRQIVFRHPLVRSAVYHAAAPSDRRAAHGALATTMRDDWQPEQRAWHLAAAARAPDEAVASALARAAEHALRRSGYASAAAALERAAQLTPADDQRRRRLLSAAHAFWLAGRSGASRALLEEALEGGADPRLRADALHLLGTIEYHDGPPMPAYRRLVEAALLVEQLAPAKAVAILTDAVEACVYAAEPKPGADAARRARQLAPRDGSYEDFMAEVNMAESLFFDGRAASGAPMFERALAIFGASAELQREPRLVTRAAIAMCWLERGAEAYELATRAVVLAREQGAIGALPQALMTLTWASRRVGAWKEGLASGSEGVELAREMEQTTIMIDCLGELSVIEANRGEEASCRRHCDEVEAITARLGLGNRAGFNVCVLGMLELALGRLEEAAVRFETCARWVEELDVHAVEAVPIPDLVETYARLGRLDDARAALARLRAGASPRFAEVLAARCAGLVAGDDEFERHFRRSLELHPKGDDGFGRARTQLCFGERLRRAGRRVDAREQLRAALETFERLGPTPWADRARGELRATGERLRRREGHQAERLTPQELQIALQVAQGKSNREVGAALFLSHKTVEFHLGRVYRKLDIRSRAQLIRRFATEAEHSIATY